MTDPPAASGANGESESAPLLAPVTPAERSPFPDVLRGLALVLILLVNAQEFAGYRPWEQQGPDRAAQVLIDLFANGKGISLFAVLFGAGLVGLGRAVGRAPRRRLAVLAALGLLHAVLLWHGDIVLSYALLGFALLWARGRPPAAQQRLALGLGGVFTAFMLLGAAALWLAASAPEAGGLPGGDRPGALLFPEGGYLQAVRERAGFLVTALLSLPLTGLWLAALMLLGMSLARRGMLTRPAEHAAAWARLRNVGLPLGLLLSLGTAFFNTLPGLGAEALAADTLAAHTLGTVFRMTGGLLFALGLAGALALSPGARSAQGGFGALAALGQLALSAYLLQSLVMTLLFYPYGLGLAAPPGSLGAVGAVGIAAALAAAQVGLARPYLARFGRGPFEALLRKLVYR